MTAAADSPRPWKAEPIADEADIYWLKSPDGTIIGSSNQQGLKLVRAVNNYEKMREALNKIASQKRTDELETACDVEYADFEQGYDDSIAVARAILKEIDNGHE